MEHPRRPRLAVGRYYRRTALALTAAVLAALTLAIAGGGVASAKPASPSAPAVTRTIRFRVTDATGHDLTVYKTDAIGGGFFRETPQNIPGVSIADYTAVRDSFNDLWAWVTYHIDGTRDYVWFYASNPAFYFKYDSTCAIELSDGSRDPSTPYTCEHTISGSGINDANATFVVEPKTASTTTLNPDSGLSGGGGLTQLQVVEGMCIPDTPPAYANCYVASSDDIKNVEIVAAPERIASKILVNCTTSPADETITSSVTTTETNTIGVSADVTAKLTDAVTAKLAPTYSHSWTYSVTTSSATKVTAQPHQYLYMAESIWMQEVTATYTVIAGNQTFRVTDVPLLRPYTGDAYKNIAVARTFSVPAGFCEGKSKTAPFFQPQPITPEAGQLYSLRPDGANFRSIAVPDSSHQQDVPLKLGTASATARNQLWLFLQIPGVEAYEDYYQLRSFNTPSMCLEVYLPNNRQIVQHACKAADDPYLKIQLWKPVLDPVSNTLEMVSLYTLGGLPFYLVVDKPGLNIGDPIIGLTQPTSYEPRDWEFWQE